jgi:ketosteroid isomerase-like protein
MIGSWSRHFLNQFRVQFSLAVDEVRVLGEWAFERGGYTISLDPKAGGPAMQDIGKYITVYQRKAGDTWRMARDIWNSSNPPPGMNLAIQAMRNTIS